MFMKKCEGSPPQGPFGARRGKEVLIASVFDPPRGRPFGGGGTHRNFKKRDPIANQSNFSVCKLPSIGFKLFMAKPVYEGLG
jgi:hypothetical protein